MNSAWNEAELSAIYIHVREPRRSFFQALWLCAVLARLSVLNVKLWKTPTNLPHFIFAPAAYSCPHRCIRDAITLNFPAFSDENKKLQRRWLVQFSDLASDEPEKKTEITYVAYYLVCMAKRVYGILSLFFRICRSGQWECNAATSTESSPFFLPEIQTCIHSTITQQPAYVVVLRKSEEKNLFPNNFFFCPFAFVHTLLSSYFFLLYNFQFFLMLLLSLSLSPIAIVVFRLRHASFFLLITVFSSSSSFSWAVCSVPRYILYCFLLSFEKFHGMETLCLVANHTQQQQKKIHPALIFLCDFGESRKKRFSMMIKRLAFACANCVDLSFLSFLCSARTAIFSDEFAAALEW